MKKRYEVQVSRRLVQYVFCESSLGANAMVYFLQTFLDAATGHDSR